MIERASTATFSGALPPAPVLGAPGVAVLLVVPDVPLVLLFKVPDVPEEGDVPLVLVCPLTFMLLPFTELLFALFVVGVWYS